MYFSSLNADARKEQIWITIRKALHAAVNCIYC
jgi:hypothetical protein